MAEYRLYRLHPDHGHITGAEDLQAANDAAALRAVEQLGYPVPVELWAGTRKVCHVEVPPQAAAFWPRPLGAALG